MSRARRAEPRLARALPPLAAGALAGGAAGTGAAAGMVAVLVVGAAAVAAAALAGGGERLRVVIGAAAVGFAVMAGRAWLGERVLAPDHVARRVLGGVVALDGVVVEQDRAGAALRLTLRAERWRDPVVASPASGLVGVTIAHPRRAWMPGSRVRLIGRLKRPRNFGNPGGYDHMRALARRGILVTAFVWNDDALTELVPAGAGPASWAARVRVSVDTSLRRVARQPARGFLAAVLLGAGGAVDRETQGVLARTGLTHVVSVSGFHLAVVAGAGVLGIGWLLGRFERCALGIDTAKVAALAGLAPALAYAAVAGGSVPAARALAMYVVLVGALLADRPADGVRALAAAALALALAVPDVVADVSFELSFASVAALILVAGRPSRPRTPERSRLGAAGRTGRLARVLARGDELVRESLRLSLAAALATAPLTAWHFQQVSLIAPIANLVALPLLGPATLIPGLVALPLLALAPRLGEALLRAAALPATLGLEVASALARVPGAALGTPMPSGTELALCYAALALPFVPRSCAAARARPLVARRRAAALLARPRRALACALLVAAVADVGYWVWERLLDPRLRVTFLAVGQGDAAVVELPSGGVLVVDGGGFTGSAFDTGERLVAPFLHARKVVRLEALVLSHPQYDHYGGLAYLAERFAPREFWSNGMRAETPGFARLEAALERAGTRVRVLDRDAAPLVAGATRVEVVHPAPRERGDTASVNDRSLVLRLTAAGASVLFTGDIEAGAEATLAAAGRPLASVLLKVPHHGSATSSSPALLAAVAPLVAVVSDGADNRFGFPAAAVLARLAAAGASVWRTDRDGAIRVVADGARLVVSAPTSGRAAQVLDLKSLHPFGSSERLRKPLDEDTRGSQRVP